jgi:hypothetical protein
VTPLRLTVLSLPRSAIARISRRPARPLVVARFCSPLLLILLTLRRLLHRRVLRRVLRRLVRRLAAALALVVASRVITLALAPFALITTLSLVTARHCGDAQQHEIKHYS